MAFPHIFSGADTPSSPMPLARTARTVSASFSRAESTVGSSPLNKFEEMLVDTCPLVIFLMCHLLKVCQKICFLSCFVQKTKFFIDE